MFAEGDKVVYPRHGAAVVESVVQREIAGERGTYLKLQIPRVGLTIMVPAESAEQVGLRRVSSPEELHAVFTLLQEAESSMPDLWSQRFKASLDKLICGDIRQGAEIIRDLTLRERRKGISPAEKRLLLKARALLVSELMLALGASEQEAEAMIDEALGGSSATTPAAPRAAGAVGPRFG